MEQAFLIMGIMCFAVMGPAIVIAVIGYATVKALGRNPSAAPKIYLGVILMLVFAEATSIIALMIIFQLFSVGNA